MRDRKMQQAHSVGQNAALEELAEDELEATLEVFFARGLTGVTRDVAFKAYYEQLAINDEPS